MPINAHPEYIAAEKEYLLAQTNEERIDKLKNMISVAPSHKGAENLRAQLKTRLKKLLEQQEKSKKAGKSSKKGIKKEDMQVIIIGKTNSGKSTLLNSLTNAEPKIAEYKFTTEEPVIGILNYEGVQIQTIENPAVESENYDKGLTHITDTIIFLVEDFEQIEEYFQKIKNSSKAKIILAYNKIDKLNSEEKRKLEAKLKSKRYNFVLISAKNKEGLDELKEKIFQTFDKIRIYTKEPSKEKSPRPIIMKPDSTVKDIAEKILHGFSKQVSETKIWGPSSKFPGQKVGLKHRLKDLDIVEFKTR